MNENLSQMGSQPATEKSNSGRRSAMIFTTSLLLLLMHCGAAIVMTIANSFESVKRGEIAESTAWLVSIGCGVLGLALAVFVAFCAVSFVEFVATDAAAGAPPPHPKRRTLRLVA